MKRLLSAVSLVAFLAASPCSAQEIVSDPPAEASLVEQIANQLEQIAQYATQITALTNLVSLGTVAGMLLGDSVSPAVTELVNASTAAYNSTNTAYGSIMAVPARVDAELAIFTPPPDGYGGLTTGDLIYRAQRARTLLQGTGVATVSNQAKASERALALQQQATRANAMADSSVSALSATQAAAQQARVAAMRLEEMQKTQSDMANTIALQVARQLTDEDVRDAYEAADVAAMKARAAGPAATMAQNPITWGR